MAHSGWVGLSHNDATLSFHCQNVRHTEVLMLKNSLPRIYQKLLPEELLQLKPNEKLANCNDCYRAKRSHPEPHYDPRWKCCTYYPFIPNYLVGETLWSFDNTLQTGPSSHELKSGVLSMLQLIQHRQFALPIGVCPPPGYQKLFRDKKPSDYGQREDLLCPFYLRSEGEGKCSIWPYRGHECATFFCVSSYGQKGEAFWQLLRDILFQVEMHISQMAMVEKGYTPREIDLNLSFIRRSSDDSRKDWSLEATEWAQFWVHHQDSIKGYYISTFEFVNRCQNELKKELHERLKHDYARAIDTRF